MQFTRNIYLYVHRTLSLEFCVNFERITNIYTLTRAISKLSCRQIGLWRLTCATDEELRLVAKILLQYFFWYLLNIQYGPSSIHVRSIYFLVDNSIDCLKAHPVETFTKGSFWLRQSGVYLTANHEMWSCVSRCQRHNAFPCQWFSS